MKQPRLIPFLLLMTLAGLWLAVHISFQSSAPPDVEAMHRRVVFDAIGMLVGTILGYRLTVDFIRTEGHATVRMQTELALAHGIQATLVPTLSLQVDRFEVYGKSIPSTEMGGDLIDVVVSDGTLLAYVADISGHGLAAGQLMGMLKTAIRVSLQFRQQPTAILESADRVLPAVKEPNMYATLALLYFDGSSEAEYSLAGHPPILHYRGPTREVARLAMEQFPLGLMPGGRYSSERVAYSSRDLFLMKRRFGSTSRINRHKSLALIGSASAQGGEVSVDPNLSAALIQQQLFCMSIIGGTLDPLQRGRGGSL
jgi:hypothetical protein